MATVSSDVASVDEYLAALWDSKGTDLMLAPGSGPRMRIDGELVPLAGSTTLVPADTESMLRSLITGEQWIDFESGDLDFSFTWRNLARIRGNAYRQRGSIAIVLRMMPSNIPSFDELGLPESVRELAALSHGVVLVTGPTGSGKSTTLASLINWINNNRSVHVLTIEDPIEYVHWHQQAIITQRSIGQDAETFASALRSAMREDPDVLLVGELRDKESIGAALSMAKTGHLVFSTLHTTGATQAVERLLDAYAVDVQSQMRAQLAGLLTAVVYQRLLPRVGGGQVAAFEVMIMTAPVRNKIREGKINQLRNELQMGSRDGMQTLEASMNKLISEGLISYETALSRALYPNEIRKS